MTTGKAAALTASLLARKGEAAPAVSATAFTNPNIAWAENNGTADANWFRRQPERSANRAPAMEPKDARMEQHRQSRIVEEMNPILVAPKPQPVRDVKPAPTRTVRPMPAPTEAVTPPKPAETVVPPAAPKPAVAKKSAPLPTATADDKAKQVAVTLRLEDEVYLRLKLFSAKTRRTNQNILLDALNVYLNGNTSGGPNGCHCLRPKV